MACLLFLDGTTLCALWLCALWLCGQIPIIHKQSWKPAQLLFSVRMTPKSPKLVCNSRPGAAPNAGYLPTTRIPIGLIPIKFMLLAFGDSCSPGPVAGQVRQVKLTPPPSMLAAAACGACVGDGCFLEPVAGQVSQGPP